MPKAEEIKMLIEWCEKRKKEVGRIPILDRNPFRDVDWLRNKVFILIDQQLEKANKMGIVYDSTTKTLYEYANGVWRRIE